MLSVRKVAESSRGETFIIEGEKPMELAVQSCLKSVGISLLCDWMYWLSFIATEQVLAAPTRSHA